jgi:MFS family permease
MTLKNLKHRGIFSLPLTIWGVGLVTLLLNFSTIIIFSLSPLYLRKEFGISCLGLGMLEGVVEFFALTTRIFAGVISDVLHKRKPLLFGSIALAAIARPIFPLATSMSWIYLSRILDRIANGLQATPREALIGDYAPVGLRGASYGLRESLGKIGSFLGAALTVLWCLLHLSSYREIFWVASIPPLIAVLLVVFLVKDVVYTEESKRPKPSIFSWSNVTKLNREFWLVILISFLFMHSNYAGTFMLLQAKQVVQSDVIAPLCMTVQNIAAMLTAYPIGYLFDRWNHRVLLGLGLLIVIAANTCLTFATSWELILLGAAFWGIQMAMTQTLLVASVAANCQQENRGTAFAIYYLFIGLSFLASNMIVGKLSDLYSLPYGFSYSSLIAALAFFFLPLIKNSQRD